MTPFLFITLLDYVLRETLLNNIDGLTIIPGEKNLKTAVETIAAY